MKIVSISELVRADGISIYPLVRYVFPDDVAKTLVNAVAKKAEYTVSSFNAYERRYCAQHDGRLAFFRHTAWGDQLMATAVVSAIKALRPDLRIDVYCSPTVITMWEGLAKAYPSPMHFDAVKSYTYHAFYEGMLENNGEPDQDNAIDDMLGYIGFKKEDVPDNLKVPVVNVHVNDFKELNELGMKWVKDIPYCLIQLQASNPNRTYPPIQTYSLISEILATTKLSVILVGQDKDKAIGNIFDSLSSKWGNRFVNLVDKLTHFRSHVPLVKFAKVIICPDSSVGHLGAAFPSVPVISLWGLFHPNDRVKYYKNHIPLCGFEVCPHAPCHNHQFSLPQVMCKDATNAVKGQQKFCNALRSISVEQIINTLKGVV